MGRWIRKAGRPDGDAGQPLHCMCLERRSGQKEMPIEEGAEQPIAGRAERSQFIGCWWASDAHGRVHDEAHAGLMRHGCFLWKFIVLVRRGLYGLVLHCMCCSGQFFSLVLIFLVLLKKLSRMGQSIQVQYVCVTCFGIASAVLVQACSNGISLVWSLAVGAW
ncbi:hypothetical protein IWX90DRAFT_306623 [Phyllosticta citrichinensis]|uniref:Uncharacterized protein n=1 Tax=Phyllosticta citrichinensis TaxID=1130410 RepID=A0ABR1XLH7_9PEZI